MIAENIKTIGWSLVFGRSVLNTSLEHLTKFSLVDSFDLLLPEHLMAPLCGPLARLSEQAGVHRCSPGLTWPLSHKR